MNIVIFAFTFLFPILAMAEGPYELLQKNFLSSNQVPKIASFDNVASTTQTQRCVSAAKDDSEPHLYYILRKYLRSTEGKPADGPLFPGTPYIGQTTLIFTDSAPEKLPIDGFTVTENANELIISNRDLTEHVYIRTNKEGLLFFHLDGFEDEYGYCFPEYKSKASEEVR